MKYNWKDLLVDAAIVAVVLGAVHSVGYEITFFAVNPVPIATSPITKIHLDLSLESSLFIKLTC